MPHPVRSPEQAAAARSVALHRRPRRRAMTLPELVLALAIASTVAIALGNVVTQVTRSVTRQEHRSQNQTEAALCLLRLRCELRETLAINTLTAHRISFLHPDVNGDGTPDVVTYDWDGTAGSDLTRDVNGAGAETVLSECDSFNLTGLTTTPVTEELIAGHMSYAPGATFTRQEYTTTRTSYAAEIFTPARTGAATFRVTRARVYLRPITATGSVHVGLRTVTATIPAWSSLEFVSRPITQLNPSGGWEDFRFGTNSGLALASSFALNVRCGSTGGSVGVAYDQITSSVPGTSTDYLRYSTNSGGTWQPLSNLPACDLKYLVYGRFYDASGNALAMSATTITAVEIHLEAGDSSAPVRFDSAVHCVNTPEQVQ